MGKQYETGGYLKLIAKFDAIKTPEDLMEFNTQVSHKGTEANKQWKAMTKNERNFLLTLREGRELQFRNQKLWD